MRHRRFEFCGRQGGRYSGVLHDRKDGCASSASRGSPSSRAAGEGVVEFLGVEVSTARLHWMRYTEMPIGLLTLEIHVLDARSLKDKRQVLRSLKDRLRAHYNVAVAELEHQDLWQRSKIGVVSISGDGKHLEESLAAVAAESERMLGRDLVSQEIDYFEDSE